MSPLSSLTKKLASDEARLILRFLAVGLLNTGFGYVIFALLIAVHLAEPIALIGAAMAGIAFNYKTLSLLVFKSPGSLLRFLGAYTLVIGLNTGALRALNGMGFGALAAQAVLTGPAAALSFFLQRYYVFAISRTRAAIARRH
jgi:putative flippase GtrA